MLPSNPKIQYVTKGGIFQTKFSQGDEIYNESALIKILKSLRPFNMLTVKMCSETEFFREWSKQVLDSLYFPK